MQKRDNRKHLLRNYLLVAFFYGLLGLLDALFFSRSGFISDITTYHYLATLVFFSFFIFSIVALVYFIQDQLPRITWVLPMYTIVTKILLVVTAFVWASSFASAHVNVGTQLVPPLLIYVALLFSLFECTFSVYLLRKCNLV